LKILLLGILIGAFLMLVMRSRKGTAQLDPRYRKELRVKTWKHIWKSTYWFWVLLVIVFLFLEMDCVRYAAE
jgi:hypothetical protein